MKKTNLYAKKTLSVFMAIMMLMSAWVFVAPTEAEAIASNVRGVPAIRGSHYAGSTGAYGMELFDGNLNRWFKFHNQSVDYVQIYYPSAIYLDKSETLQSAGYFFNVDWHFGNSTDYRILIGANALGDNIQWSGKPDNYYTMTNAFNNYGFDASVPQGVSNPWVYGKDMTDGNSHNLRIVGYGHSSQGSDQFSYQNVTHTKYVLFKSHGNNDPNKATIYLMGTPKGTYSGTYSTSGDSFTSYGYQQNWGNSWKTNNNSMFHQKGYGNGDTTSSNHNPGGWPEMEWNVVIYDKSTLNSNINSAKSNYPNNNSGKYTATSFSNLQTAISNAETVLKTRETTQSNINNAASKITTAINDLQLQNYTLKFVDYKGTVKQTYTYPYGTSVNCASLAASIPNTVENIATNNSQHQTYVWNTNNYVNTLTSDVTVTESKDRLVDHTYGVWTQDEASHTRTCSVCGHVHTQAHINDEGTITKADTCTQAGEKTYNCTVCGKTAIATETVDTIKGHSFNGEIVENVKGENGNHWRKCTRCDVYGWGTTANACETHKWSKKSSVASTCKVQGSETYECTVCEATYTKTLDFADHKTTKTAAKDVANICGGDGNVAFWSCSVCGKFWKDEALTDVVTDLTDADSDGIPDVLEVKGPDHEFTGAYVSVSTGIDGKHHRQCKRFDQCKTYGPEEAHKYGDPVVTPSSCIAEGKKVYTCADCGQTYTETIEKLAHTMTKIEAVAPECGKSGNNEYYSCSTCSMYYKDANGTTETTVKAETLAALTHTWTAHHDYDTIKTPATCQAAAVYYKHCDYCKVQLTGEYSHGEVDKVNGHKFNGELKNNADGTHSYKCTVAGCAEYGSKTTCDFSIVKSEVASTCHTIGYIIYECTECKAEKRVEKTALDFNNHEGGEEIRFASAATCNSNGYTGDTYCRGCNAKIKTGAAIVADKTVHPHEKMEDFAKVDSTCQTEGYSAYRYCSACGTYEIAKETIPVKAHKFTKYTTNNNGTHTAICDTCDEAFSPKATDTQNCAGGTANCVDAKVCTVCNTAYGTTDATNHKTVKIMSKKDSTCQTEGYEPYRYCEACGKDIEVKTVIAKKAHAYGAWTSNGDGTHTRSCETCDADVAAVATQSGDCAGGEAYCNAKAVCSTCGEEYGEIDSANHKTEAWHYGENKKAATCQAEGNTGDKLYDCCDALKEAGSATAKLDHKFDNEVTRTPATCIAVGSVTKKCSTCVESEGVTAATNTEELPIDLKNHASKEVKVVGKKAATCEEDGYTGDTYHACCYDENVSDSANRKALISRGSVIKANGQHIFGKAIPEYMITEITKDENGKQTIVLKTAEPDYDGKVAARHDDGKWYHAKVCTICDAIVYEACYTYAHTYSCKKTDICEVCEGLCSLIDENKHDLDVVRGKEASESEEGVKDYYQCKDCAECFLDEVGTKSFDPTTDEGKALLVIPVITASCNWDTEYTVTVEPTCVKDGEKVYKCKDDDCDKTKTVVIPATGKHTWSSEYTVTKEPTCGNNGYKAIKCENCDAIKSGSYVAIPTEGEHDYKLVNETEGKSCTDPAILTYECAVCGDTYKTESTEGVSAHTWGDWIAKGGDCSTGVIQVRICSTCQLQERRIETTVSHNLVIKVKLEPTCETEGYIERVCKNCGYVPEREIIPATSAAEGHLINTENYKTISKATCESAEKRQYTCTLCNEKVVKYYGEPLEHVWLLQTAEKATCERDGHGEYYRCVRCERAEVEPEIYKATGHNDGDNDGKCDSCSSVFYEKGNEPCTCMCHSDRGLMKLLYKLVSIIWKLFKINPSCACGNAHY